MRIIKNIAYLFLLSGIIALFAWHFRAETPSYERVQASFVQPQPVYLCTPSQEICDALNNPYCGYYHIYGFALSDKAVYQSPEDVPVYIDAPERLVQLQILLSDFRDKPLSETALSQLDLILSAYAAEGRQILLRFLYDWSGDSVHTEPQDIQILLTHMEQTASVYNRYKDNILTLQGFYTGNYGEMGSTSYGSNEALQMLAEKQISVTDPLIYLSVRTPNQWRIVTGADSYAELAEQNASPFLGRLGLFNDGMLGSGSDVGTYTDKSREEELQFQDFLCQTVPNGGEVVIDNPYNDLENAVDALSRMHVSYLNSVYDPAVIQKWKNSFWSSQDCFQGMSGFDYIDRHLGYRYVIRESGLLPGEHDDLLLSIAIENVGFAPGCRPFNFTLTLLSEDDGTICPLPLPIRSGDLPGGKVSRFLQPLDTDSFPVGNYRLYLKIQDETTEEVIRCANDLPLTEYGYELGSLCIPLKFNHQNIR